MQHTVCGRRLEQHCDKELAGAVLLFGCQTVLLHLEEPKLISPVRGSYRG
jgi:hypothetical protein